jgi:membrane protein DedA with SNARE-associated domain
MRSRLLIWILWPSFLVAGIAEGLLFTVIHPDDILLFGESITISNEGIYTLGFFILWAFCASSSALSIFVLPKAGEGPKICEDEADLI